MALLERTVTLNPFIPHQTGTDRQNEFLALTCREVLFGGAAGGGKSESLLMAALQFVEIPGYAALLLRRTFADLALPGALIDRSREWLDGKAKWNGQDHRWTFPSGAVLQFGYCDHSGDERRYKSSEFQMIGFDELTEFSEAPYLFLFSRLRRRAGVQVPLRMRAASNPGGCGHEWVKRRFTPNEPTAPTGRVFVPARLTDNPFIDQPAYIESLSNVDPITRAQLLAGDWDTYPGGRFLREWFRRYDHINQSFGQGGEYALSRLDAVNGWVSDGQFRADQCWRFQTCDPAASEKTTADYTVICTWAVTPDWRLILLDVHRFQAAIPDIVPQVQAAYALWSPEYVAIEAVAANSAVYQYAARTSMIVKEISPRGLDKLVRATKAMVLAKSGRLYLPHRAHWLGDYETELLLFTGNDKEDAHDDQVDSTSIAASCLEEHDESPAAMPMTLTPRGW